MSNSLPPRPWAVAYRAPLSMGFSKQEYWSGLPFPSPRDLPDPGIEPGSSALEADALTLSHQEKLSNLSVQFSGSIVSNSLPPHESKHHASLSITNSWNLLKPISIVSVMPSNQSILCRPLLLLPPVPPSIQWGNFSHEVAKVLEFQLQHQSFQWTLRTDLF